MNGDCDTHDVYAVENVSYGDWIEGDTIILSDKTEVTFSDSCIEDFTSIDERNLVLCLFLNLECSTITSFNAVHLGHLRVLNLMRTVIVSVCTKSLTNL